MPNCYSHLHQASETRNTGQQQCQHKSAIQARKTGQNTNLFQFHNGPQKVLFTQYAPCQQVHSDISHPGILLWAEMIQQKATMNITIMSSAKTNIWVDTSNTGFFATVSHKLKAICKRIRLLWLSVYEGLQNLFFSARCHESYGAKP